MKRKQFKKLVIMGNHPGLSYEAALEKELTLGCRVKDKIGFSFTVLMQNHAGNYLCRLVTAQRTMKRNEIKEIIGLPITLGRVMQALNQYDKYEYSISNVATQLNSVCIAYRMWQYEDCTNMSDLTNWQLTKDGKECTDDDQSDETIKALLKLFT